MKKKNGITILTIGDKLDFDSYKKLHKEKRFILGQGFDYRTIDDMSLLKGHIPNIPTNKVIIFVFFPFVYWDKFIEHRRYRGIYGNYTFYRKFRNFSKKLVKIIKKNMPEKEILFINNPLASSLYRDKMLVMKTLAKSSVLVPPPINIRNVDSIKQLLKKGNKLFIKPCCGSMGKGITFLELGDWQTNFKFKNNRIISRRSDYGWHFKEITGNTGFLRKLLSKDVFIEKAVEPLNIKGDRIDFRVYVFFNEVLYVYPRRNKIDEVTTNISQGGRGDPGLLKVIPENIISHVKRTAIKATKALGLKFSGVDVIVDSSLKNAYTVDINMFSGFPKRKTFNLARRVIKGLKTLDKKGMLHYTKGAKICDHL